MSNINFYTKFSSYGYDAYLHAFQQYYKKFPKQYDAKLKLLKQDLDEQSIHNIDFFLNLILSLPLPSCDFLIKSSRLLDERYTEELRQEKVFLEKLDVYKAQLGHILQGYEKYELNVFKYHCGLKFIPKVNLKNKIIIDVGAFWGDSALMLSRYSATQIICFEPNQVNFNLLEQTKQNNAMHNWVLYNMGAYHKNTSGIMHYISNNQNHGASLVFKPYAHHKIHNTNLIKLDDCIANKHGNTKAGDIALLKVDAEGVGYNVLQGAKHIITTHKPIISCAIYHNPMELFKVKALLLSLNPNYKIKIVNLNNGFLLKELTLLAY